MSVLAAALPARRAALVPPVEALRDEVLAAGALADPTGRRRGSRWWCWASPRSCSRCWTRPRTTPARCSGSARARSSSGCWPRRRCWRAGSCGWSSLPFAAWRPVGPLARGNVTRNPRRTANTAGALMIGMALVGAAAVIAATTQASTSAIVTQEATTDYILRGAAQGTVPEQAVVAVRALPDVRAADTFATASVLVGDSAFADHRDRPRPPIGRSIRTEVVEGDFPAALAAGEVAVQRTTMDDEDWSLGQELELVGSSGVADAHDRRGHRLARVRGAVRRVAGRARPALPARRAAGDHGLRHGGGRGRRRGAARRAHRGGPPVRRRLGDGQRGVRLGPGRAGGPGARDPLRAARAVGRHRGARHRQHARAVRDRAHPRDRAAARGRPGPAPAGDHDHARVGAHRRVRHDRRAGRWGSRSPRRCRRCSRTWDCGRSRSRGRASR